MIYLDFFKKIHENLRPELYVEIGIRNGRALRLASCAAIGIDPQPNINVELHNKIKIFAKTSDDFFSTEDFDVIAENKIDLSFIDGFHNFEFALRDFINLERRSKSSAMIVLDDVRPRNPKEASRKPTGGSWTGDIYKIFFCLQTYRPDIKMSLINTSPTGLLVLENLDPSSTALRDRYGEIFSEYVGDGSDRFPEKEYFDLFIKPETYLWDRFGIKCD
jgi:hypothetical protein